MKRFLFIFISLMCTACFAAAGYTAFALLNSPNKLTEDTIISIAPGQGTRAITRMLAREGAIRNALLTEMYARLTGTDTGLQAGRYLLTPDMAAVEVMQKIHTGDAVFEHIRVTIPEGWMINQIDAHLASIGIYQSGDFIHAVETFPRDTDLFPLLAHIPPQVSLEGYLYPQTYFILAETEPSNLVFRMIEELHRRLPDDIETQAAEQNMTVHEILTLASIVQKESPAGDKPAIAGVFHNRLRHRIRLESDATVNYVLGTRNLQPTFADTAVQHPYNTYRNFGLPPGPIGNPGMEAIDASLHPDEHDYQFFLHKPNQETVFSYTYAEHLAAKRRYLD
ncbi:MAG: endolytic transglycosylase MltG [Spirochaeta sp.]